MILRLSISLFASLLLAITSDASAANGSQPIEEPVLEPATLHCLAVHWLIRGDENQNATVAISYRKIGAARWIEGAPLLRVERNSTHNERGQSSVEIPQDGWLFAGSVFVLEPGTAYELKLTLHDPDGGDAQRILRCSTISEPVAPKDARMLWAVPGSVEGDGSEASGRTAKTQILRCAQDDVFRLGFLGIGLHASIDGAGRSTGGGTVLVADLSISCSPRGYSLVLIHWR